jgi:hypothetical protein
VSGLVSADGGLAGDKSGSGADGLGLSHPVVMARTVSRMKNFIKDRNFSGIAIIGF